MARGPAKVYTPSRPLTLAFLALLLPVCLWGMEIAWANFMALTFFGVSWNLGISLLCGLAMVLPIPFALQGLRPAMVPPVLGLLVSMLALLQLRLGGSQDALLLLVFALGGVYCVTLSYLFRRARPLLAGLDRKLFAPSWFMGLAFLPFSLAFMDSGTLGLGVSLLLLAGALPGLLYPGFRVLCACVGLAYTLAGLAWAIRDKVAALPMDAEGLEMAGAYQILDMGFMAFSALLLGLALWLHWRQRKERV